MLKSWSETGCSFSAPSLIQLDLLNLGSLKGSGVVVAPFGATSGFQG